MTVYLCLCSHELADHHTAGRSPCTHRACGCNGYRADTSSPVSGEDADNGRGRLMPPPEPSPGAVSPELAAWILLALVKPTDRALAGWCPAGEAVLEAEALTAATEGAA